VIVDQARVELVNSLTPYGANAFLLNQLGQIYGVPVGQESNTSVYEIFSGPVGFIIAVGFTVSDGSHQYTVQDGGVIGAGGTSSPLFCLATVPGSWAVPDNTVTGIITSVPSEVNLTVTNPEAGTPGGDAESESSYRAQVLQAGLAASQGMGRYLKTLLGNVAGVQRRLVAVKQIIGGGWEVICGGGDPYEVAYAIYMSLFDISTLTGSTLLVSNITKANPGIVTTVLNHGYSNGQVINIASVLGMTAVNNVPLTVTVITEKTFSIGVDTSAYGNYISGGVVTPNLRNVSVTLNDYPDTYLIPFVNPPQQDVSIVLTWNTTATNFVSEAAVAQLGAPALANYVNNVAVGMPLNLFEMESVFQVAIQSLLPASLLTRMVFAVSINGVGTSPESGTGIIEGDPESFFLTTSTNVVIVQG
jgi:hypothetical protein